MINTTILSSIFQSHNIDCVSYLKNEDDYIFLIQKMDSSLSLERWIHLENVLKDVTKSDISILSYDYAKKYIDISKAMVIKQWTAILSYY